MMFRMQYTILRRAIRFGNEKKKKIYSREELVQLCDEIEGEALPSTLKEIHKEWIGY